MCVCVEMGWGTQEASHYANSFICRQALEVPLEKTLLLIGGRGPPVSREQGPPDSGWGLVNTACSRCGHESGAGRTLADPSHLREAPGPEEVVCQNSGRLDKTFSSLTFCDRHHSGKGEC